MRRAILALCLFLAASPAAADGWGLFGPPVDHDLLNVILQGRRTPPESEPSDLEWRALETLEAIAYARSDAERARAFTRAVIRAGAPQSEWSLLATARSSPDCEEIRATIAADPTPQGSQAMNELMRARARLGRCVQAD